LRKMREQEEEEQRDRRNHSHSHSHSHTHSGHGFDNTTALTVFRYAVEEWSLNPPNYVKIVIASLQAHWNVFSAAKVLVVGCRMGRLQYEIQQKWK
jgi:ABC-type Zn2+ transport system substrate-binding protein/surface adhesin